MDVGLIHMYLNHAQYGEIPLISAVFEEPGSEVDLYVYVVGSLGLVALAVTVLLTALAISHFCRRYRLRKQMRRALLVRDHTMLS